MSAIDTLTHIQLAELAQTFPVYWPLDNGKDACFANISEETNVPPEAIHKSEYLFIGGGSGEFPAGGVSILDALLTYAYYNTSILSHKNIPDELVHPSLRAPVLGWRLDEYLAVGSKMVHEIEASTVDCTLLPNDFLHTILMFALGKLLVDHVPNHLIPETIMGEVGCTAREIHLWCKNYLDNNAPLDSELNELSDLLLVYQPAPLGGKLVNPDDTAKWGAGLPDYLARHK